MATYRLGKSDGGKVVSVRQGDEIVVALPENPTTGYRWAIDLSGSILKLAGPPAFLGTGETVGSGGVRTFTVIAEEVGDSVLTFQLRRPWETDPPSATDIPFHIRVLGMNFHVPARKTTF
jgi:inhibitor of cysteine peptidase